MVHFHLKKAYDTAWRIGILSDLKSFVVSGNMMNTFRSHLFEKTFCVRVSSAFKGFMCKETAFRKVEFQAALYS